MAEEAEGGESLPLGPGTGILNSQGEHFPDLRHPCAAERGAAQSGYGRGRIGGEEAAPAIHVFLKAGVEGGAGLLPKIGDGGHFATGEAIEADGVPGRALDEPGFHAVGGLGVLGPGLGTLLEGGFVLRSDEDAGGQTVFQGVAAGSVLAFLGDGTAGLATVLSAGLAAGLGVVEGHGDQSAFGVAASRRRGQRRTHVGPAGGRLILSSEFRAGIIAFS